MFKTAMWWASCMLCGIVLLTHFTLVQLSNMPFNVITYQMRGLIDAYVNPLFTQNWSFFAPQPLDRDLTLLARGQFTDAKSGRHQTTPWIDVSDPLTAAVRHNHFTPLQLVAMTLSQAVVSFNNTLATNSAAVFTKQGKTYVRPLIPATVDVPDVAVLTRTGMAALEVTFPGRHFTAVQVGYVIHEFPRFTQRFTRDTTAHDAFSVVQWLPASPVATF